MNINMSKNHAIPAIAIGAVLVAGAGVGVMYAIQDHSSEGRDDVGSGHREPPSTPGKPLVAGKYDFNILGGKSVPVMLEPCGPECLLLNAPPSETNPDGFKKRELRKEGNLYVGVAAEPVGPNRHRRWSRTRQRPSTPSASGRDGRDGLGPRCAILGPRRAEHPARLHADPKGGVSS